MWVLAWYVRCVPGFHSPFPDNSKQSPKFLRASLHPGARAKGMKRGQDAMPLSISPTPTGFSLVNTYCNY